MEIGIWKAKTSLKLINIAKQFHLNKEMEFYGFDLFETFNFQIIKGEGSDKVIPLSIEQVYNLLKVTGINIELFKGNTKKVMPEVVSKIPKMDLIFIDGGHSIETIASDWKNCKKLMYNSTVVVFDDYWDKNNNRGCKRLIDSLDRKTFKVNILEPKDIFPKFNNYMVGVKLL